MEGRANDSFYSEDGKRIYLFDIERIVLEDEMVAQCKAVAVQINGKFKPILHVVLQKNGVTDAKTVIPRIYKSYQNSFHKMQSRWHINCVRHCRFIQMEKETLRR